MDLRDISAVELVILILGVYRLTRLVVQDTILEPVRDWIWNRWGYDRGIGYLISCYWCTSFWFASLVVILYTIVSVPTLAAMLVLAISAAVGIIAARMDR
jgi:hypothetical protein